MIDQEKRTDKKKFSPGKIIALILVLLMAEPEILNLVLVLAAIAVPIGIVLFLLLRRNKHRKSHQRTLTHTTYTPCTREKAFDEQVQSRFCFHKDKAIHHVGRGKEIDPWDRPDIDIRKYQRKE